MTTARDLLRGKPGETWSISPDATVFDALSLMAEKDVGALLVFNEKGGLEGILSERDYARKVILKGKASRDIPVREIMTSKVVCVGPDQTIEGCMALMTLKRVRHIPVLEGERVAGIISIGDVVKSIIADQQFTIEQMESYIAGHY